MYPRNFAGVVISDEYDANQRIVIADDPFEQVYRAQAYGDDGITDGAEGLGMAQAQRLKAKLRGSRRRLRVGRSPYAVVGGSRFDYGFGLAPLAVAGVAKAAGVKISLKKGSPRVFGGPLVSTVDALRARVERGDLSAVRAIEGYARQKGKHGKAWTRILNELVPTWRTPMETTVRPRPDTAMVIKPAPAPGPATDATGAPAPSLFPVPSPIPSAAGGGGGPTASETVAAAANGEDVETKQAGLFGGIDLKNPMTMLMLGGVGLFVVSQFAGKGTSRRRSRR